MPIFFFFLINSLDHTSLQYGMKSQNPKEKLDPGKQDSLEDLRRYSYIKASTFMETRSTLCEYSEVLISQYSSKWTDGFS